MLDVINESKAAHAVLMFDELALEKRIRWDSKSNCFLGVCREHAHKASMEFINEGDVEELFVKLDSGEIHYATEVRTFQICFRLEVNNSHFRQQLVVWVFSPKTIAYILLGLSSYLAIASMKQETSILNFFRRLTPV